MLERTLEEYIKAQCTSLGILCIKQQGTRGVPDRLLVRDGQVLFLELKTETGKLSEMQKDWIKKLRDQGMTVIVARDRSDIDSVLWNFFLGT